MSWWLPSELQIKVKLTIMLDIVIHLRACWRQEQLEMVTLALFWPYEWQNEQSQLHVNSCCTLKISLRSPKSRYQRYYSFKDDAKPNSQIHRSGISGVYDKNQFKEKSTRSIGQDNGNRPFSWRFNLKRWLQCSLCECMSYSYGKLINQHKYVCTMHTTVQQYVCHTYMLDRLMYIH